MTDTHKNTDMPYVSEGLWLNVLITEDNHLEQRQHLLFGVMVRPGIEPEPSAT